MIHQTWEQKQTVKTVACVHTDANKYIVNRVLTVGKTYEVKNETEEFYFIIDNSGKVGGFYKDYFKEA
ncbi:MULTISPECIES: DUF6501 family protein [Niallia]|uniref:Uncharacterized protein n=1 Tax=Niallia nealsonii TaxID=115979 RepID=A0A2N0YYV0_9BACI|nr:MULTISPECIES: DUF6501 family protein [Niallia]PKG22438.1 hypothetical protein CWS01_17675 [Niallia nealsonii]GKU82834.1 hypothetical protein NCCP28_22300 [Niallia sp. NCCP-28]